MSIYLTLTIVVVSTAVRSSAEIIVTFNIQDLPASVLDAFGFEALLNRALELSAVTTQRSNLRKLPISVDDYLACIIPFSEAIPFTACLVIFFI